MQNKELDKLTQMYIRNKPFVKALILSDLTEGVEVHKYVAEDLEFSIDDSTKSREKYENYLNGIRAAMNSLYTEFKN